MADKHWTLDDIPWGDFDPSKVDPELIRVVKAASLVEYNGGDYARYLRNIFADDEVFRDEAINWAKEEVQHGEALGRWAKLADPSFDFDAAFKRFTDGYSIPVDSTDSVRGSRSGELVARCIVETGTSSYYAALGEASEEPVLKAICKKIAADELCHYKLFYSYLKQYLEKEKIGRFRRLLVALSRIRESEDDELAYAYYAANGSEESYDRERWCAEYRRLAYGFYRPHHVERAVKMGFKAAGLSPQSRLARYVAGGAFRLIKWRHAEDVRAAA